MKSTLVCYVALISAILLQAGFAATSPSSLNGGPRLYINNNTQYKIHVTGVTWSHPDNGYYFGGFAGSKNQSYTVDARSSLSTPGPGCANSWQQAASWGGLSTTCFWGNIGSKDYNASRTLTITSDSWTKGKKDGIKIDVTKLKTGIFELEPDCKLDRCPIIEWSLEWAGDGWRIKLNEETI